MSDYLQHTLPFAHQNNSLFADYYLNRIVPTLPEWNAALLAEAQHVQAELRDLRQTIQPEQLDESQIEEVWIKPVLRIIGHQFSVQLKIRYRGNTHRKPDYGFTATAAEALAITNQIYEPEEIEHLLAIGDAKKWGVAMDRITADNNDRNPSQQIDEYLRYSERQWGILTDGNVWRLYHRGTSKYNTYYAVQLDTLLYEDAHSFLYFYAFFRQAAFTTGWLDKIRTNSENFAQNITEQLEDVVYDALEGIAQGFLDYRRNNLTERDLPIIYNESLVLLYRLLFVFYAESRRILPKNDTYVGYHSIQAIKRAVVPALTNPPNMRVDNSEFYTRLNDLFFSIDSGDPSLDMPAYNGRLFSTEEHPFLAKKFVGDAYLVPALDQLARVQVNGRREFVDYRDLEVRHLGSIYEKLLEYELDIAHEALTTRGKNQEYAPAQEGDVIIKQPGQVYLRTGNNERKITGSYYTPDYIVRFIVSKTLEPLLTDITRRYAKQDAEGQWQVEKANALIAAILNINVLDPATGSGHFVVDATAYIAEWLRDLHLKPADLNDDDELIYWKRLVAGACIYAVDINPLAVELAKLSMWLTTLAEGKPLSFLDHHIRVGNSLVGTNFSDIEDANVSVKEEERRRKARERQEQKAAASGQLSMFSDADFTTGVRFAVEQMQAIESTIANEVDDVKRQESMYAQLRERLAGWQQAADVWTARYFGLEISEEDWKTVRTLAKSGTTNGKAQRLIAKASELAQTYHFFHWELAFPEIFYDADGHPLESPGFDVVMGNPPYVRQERFSPIKPFLQSRYEVYSGTADLFLYFYELGLAFLKDAQRLGYITSGTYMNSNSAKSFRQYVHENSGFEWVANFGENQPFRGAEMVYPTIAIMRRGEPQETFQNMFIEGTVRFAELESAIDRGEWVESLSAATGMDEWRFQPAELTQLYTKLVSNRTTLSEFVDGRIYRGIVTGFNEAFVIDNSTRERLISEAANSSEIIKPMLRGQDSRPWYQIDSRQHLILSHQGIQIDKYPAVKQYLEQFRAQLEPKPSEWNDDTDGQWLGRAPGSYQWYELQSTTTDAYRSMCDGRKICWSDISKLPRFSMNDGAYFNNTAYMVGDTRFSLLGVLSSRAIWFVISQLAQPLRLRAGLWQYRLFTQFMERLPIPELTTAQENELAEIAEAITGLARARYQLHKDVRTVISAEFGERERINTRVALYEWWQFPDAKSLSDEVQKRYGKKVPLRQRAEWDDFLASERAKHDDLTAQIIEREIRLNDIVYDAFNLTPEERQLIEDQTQYPYGEV